MIHDPVVRLMADRFMPAFPTMPTAGRSGEMLGRASGSSLEFQEHRQYLPGDDIRHLDWAAYARTDNLMIRRFRDEINPRSQILLDVSASMNTGSGIKSKTARQLASLFSLMISSLGGRAEVILLGDQMPPQVLWGEEVGRLSAEPMSARADMKQIVESGKLILKPQSVRILISDFLFPHDPAVLVRQFASNSSLFQAIQVLSRFESDPDELGGRRLIDSESDAFADLRVNTATIARYKSRLDRLQSGLRDASRRLGGSFVTLVAELGLESLCANDLCRAGILRPR